MVNHAVGHLFDFMLLDTTPNFTKNADKLFQTPADFEILKTTNRFFRPNSENVVGEKSHYSTKWKPIKTENCALTLTLSEF